MSQVPSGKPGSDDLKGRIIKQLRSVHDPEIPVNIYELGLVYDLEIGDAGHVDVRMTLTSPGCPVAGMLVEQVRQKVEEVEGVAGAQVELVWDPPWSPQRMSEAARLELNMEEGDPLPKDRPKMFNINFPRK